MKTLQILDEKWDSAVTEYGLSLAAVLRDRGHASHVAARPDTHAYREAARRGLEVHPLRSLPGLRWLIGRRGYDVVNSHTGSGHFLAWAGTLLRSTALVRTRGDARPLQRNQGHALLYKRTDAVIGASVALTAQYRSLFPSLGDRLRTVYPGLPVAPAQPPEPPGPLRLAMVGRLDPIKGQIYFLEAIVSLREKLTDEEFIIAGEEKNTAVSGLQSYAEKYGISRWVRFLGRQPDIGAFMRSCHAGVICSIGSEALSRVCLEWMSQGRPVVATNVGCLPELIATGENGFLVPSHAPKPLANCFMGLIKSPEFRRDMARRAYETAAARFSLQRFAAETEKVYEEALRRKREAA